MNLLYPKINRRHLPAMLQISLAGAVIAGIYGTVHDQVSFALAPEYFTCLKFEQFAYADFGWPRRVFASVVGFLATWWVGLIVGWFLARAGLAALPPLERRRRVARALTIVFSVTVASGCLGILLGGLAARGDLSRWSDFERQLRLTDLRRFVVVAYLHWAGYLGAALGLIAALIDVWKRPSLRAADGSTAPLFRPISLAGQRGRTDEAERS